MGRRQSRLREESPPARRPGRSRFADAGRPRADQARPRAIYVTYACHCVTLSDNKISGDWAGYAPRAIEIKHPGAMALVSIGCGSDSNPSSGVTGDKTDVAAAARGRDRRRSRAAARTAQCSRSPGRSRRSSNTIDLPLNTLPTREQWEELRQEGGRPATTRSCNSPGSIAARRCSRRSTIPSKRGRSAIRLPMVFLAGEVVRRLLAAAQAGTRRERLWLHGYTNDFGATSRPSDW